MEWIKCSDRLPENKSEVLCCNKIGTFVAIYERMEAKYPPGYFDIWNSGHCCGREYGNAEWWMPLPEPPKVQNE